MKHIIEKQTFIPTNYVVGKSPPKETYPTDGNFLENLYRLYQHAKVKFPSGEFNMHIKAVSKFFNIQGNLLEHHKRLQRIYRLAEVFDFKKVDCGYRCRFVIDDDIEHNNYFCLPAKVRTLRKFNNNPFYNKNRDSLLEGSVNDWKIGRGK